MIWVTPPASSARTIWAIIPLALPTAHGFQEFWGYLYHLDAMQQVSFPDINSSPTVQGVCPAVHAGADSRNPANTRRD